MDEKTLELARRYMQKASEEMPRTDKFPVKLCDEQGMMARLLGFYGSLVESRGVEFKMDEATITKIEKVVR